MPDTVIPVIAVLVVDKPVALGVKVMLAVTDPDGPVNVGVPKVIRKPVPVTTAVKVADVAVVKLVAD